MEQQTQVLVVGAGPVGLMTALELHERGVRVSVIEENDQRDARSYAVVLHPRTLRGLIDRGIGQALVWQGCPLKHVVIFSDGEKRAALNLPPASEVSEGGLSLPQGVLRDALEQALSSRGIPVRYGRRLVSVDQDETGVRSHWVSASGTPGSVLADFVVGADGRNSTVRKLLGVELRAQGPKETFLFFDVPRDPRSGVQIELALSARTSSAMIPLHGGMMRYAFQTSEPPPRTPDRALLLDLRATRMPWHRDDIEHFEWSGVGEFGPALVDRFGDRRVWLAGDAAHQTSPLGVHSLNVGLFEAHELATGLTECLRGASRAVMGPRYEARRQTEWHRLLGSGADARLERKVPTWVRAHLAKLIPSLPASGDDLDDLLDQLGVSLP
jgi:2-polyprenyl-6-methoxyphenol hydroxylase-like FAD-dependent oxidoreductase